MAKASYDDADSLLQSAADKLQVSGGEKSVSEEYLGIMEDLRKEFAALLKGKLQVDAALKDLIEYERPPNRFEKQGDMRVIVNRILNPLAYAWPKHEEYIRRMPQEISVLFVGMNPAPYAPSGIPFGDKKEVHNFWDIDISASNFDGIPESLKTDKDCVSGRRFWKFIQKHFENIKDFHEHCFVMNCTPLVFMGKVAPASSRVTRASNSNIPLDNFDDDTTDPLVQSLMQKSDVALQDAISVMNPKLIIGIGWHAYNRVKNLDVNKRIKHQRITHPSSRVGGQGDNGGAKGRGDEKWIGQVEEELKDIVHSTIKSSKNGESVKKAKEKPRFMNLHLSSYGSRCMCYRADRYLKV